MVLILTLPWKVFERIYLAKRVPNVGPESLSPPNL
jgi:hypothetical protein